MFNDKEMYINYQTMHSHFLSSIHSSWESTNQNRIQHIDIINYQRTVANRNGESEKASEK